MTHDPDLADLRQGKVHFLAQRPNWASMEQALDR